MKSNTKVVTKRSSPKEEKKFYYDLSLKSGDIIPFGQFKGKTFDHVCQFEGSYVEWMHTNKIIDTDTLTRMHRAEFIYKNIN